MTTLVIADHDNNELKPSTLSVIAAANAISGDNVVLDAGEGCSAVAEQAAKASGVSKVLVCDNAAYANQLAENMTPLIAGLAGDYSHVMFANTASGKNIMPRVAATMDMAGISDITARQRETTSIFTSSHGWRNPPTLRKVFTKMTLRTPCVTYLPPQGAANP